MAKFDVFPSEDAAPWAPYTDAGLTSAHAQPARTRAVALQITNLCEISSDLLVYFYHPTNADKPSSKTTELKKLGEIHTRLEAWKKNLPKEMEAREGSLPPVLLMHMFFQLLYIHLFRPFLKYNQTTTPLPAHVSPQKLCTQAASSISKLLRLYKRTYGLRQICNIAVYIAHSACTIHLLNLPEKTAKRDISHGIRHLEEIGEGWLCARRTLGILGVLARRWKIDLPEEAAAILARNAAANTAYSTEEHLSYNRQSPPAAVPSPGASGRTNPGRSTTNGTSPSSNVVPRGVPSNLHSSPSNMYATTAMPAGSLSFPQTIPYATTQDMPQPYQAWQTSPTAGPVYSSPTMQLYPRAQELVQPPNKWLMDDQLGLADDFSSWPTETEASTFDGMNAPLDPSNLGINSQAFDGEGSNQWYGA
ncbi:MAG: hypothetical protein M1817_005238 [Caeruleum heppii]|nr:MAG: hypothetical protein M1817_005238 [Caeruleum heppii]